MKNKALVVFPLIVMSIMFAFLAIVMANNVSLKRAAEANRVKDLTESAKELSGRDITIYWAGDFPEEFNALADKTVMLKPGHITEDEMPVSQRYFSFTEFDSAGNVIKKSDPTEYTNDLLIVINFAEGLTDQDIEVIRECITGTNVPIFIAGKDQIINIRKAMYKITGKFEDYDTVFFDFKDGFDEHIIDPVAAEDRSVDYYQAMLDYFKAYFDRQDEIAATAEPTTFTAPPIIETSTESSDTETSGSETSENIMPVKDYTSTETSEKETSDGN